MYEMVLHSHTFEKVCTYQFMGFVAVEIKGLWLVMSTLIHFNLTSGLTIFYQLNCKYILIFNTLGNYIFLFCIIYYSY